MIPPPPDASRLPARPPKSRGDLLKDIDVPQYQKVPYILCGYRPAPKGPCGLFQTVFTIHNETGNMWTHLLGFVYMSAIGFQLVSNLAEDEPGSVSMEEAAMLALVMATAFCMLASFGYHLCMCAGQQVCECMYRMDLMGIVGLIIMSFFTGITLGYQCWPYLRKIYLGLAACVAVALAAPLMFRRLVSNMPRHLIMCAVPGLIPVVHWLYAASSEDVWKLLPYIISMGLCYAGGAFIFVEKWPERWYPGRFDLVGHSHQLWHLLVLAAATSWVRGCRMMLIDGLRCEWSEVSERLSFVEEQPG